MNNTKKFSFAGIIYQTETEVNKRGMSPSLRRYVLVSLKRTTLAQECL